MRRDLSPYAPAAPVQEFGRFDLLRSLRALSNGESLHPDDAAVREIAQADSPAARQFGANLTIPWSTLGSGRRDLNTTVASAGGYLVATEMGAAADVLRPYSVAVRAGMTTLSGLSGNLVLPAIDEEVEFDWLTAETVAGPNLTPVLGQAALQPRVACGLVKFSAQLLRAAGPQATVVKGFIFRRLLLAAGQLMDAAIMQGGSLVGNGTGDNNAEPTGLVNTPRVQAYDVTPVSDLLVEGIGPAMTYVCSRAGSDDDASWIMHPGMRQLLQANYASEPGAIRNGRLHDRAVHTTSAMAGASVAYGRWSHAVLGLWGGGIDLQVDPFTDFRSGAISIRCMLAMDVAFPNPEQFALVRLA